MDSLCLFSYLLGAGVRRPEHYESYESAMSPTAHIRTASVKYHAPAEWGIPLEYTVSYSYIGQRLIYELAILEPQEEVFV